LRSFFPRPGDGGADAKSQPKMIEFGKVGVANFASSG
jgi:hypothetical protein